MEIDYKITNIDYGYFIKQLDNGLFKLIYQKWDDGISWNMKFSPGWSEFDNGGSKHIYQTLEDAQRDGNAFMVQNAAYRVLEISNMYVTWFWKDNENNASKLPIDNLRIFDSDYKEIWSISKLFKESELCIDVYQLDDNRFYFCTFTGLGITIEIINNEVKCIESKLIK